jgi:hypothetical protein
MLEELKCEMREMREALEDEKALRKYLETDAAGRPLQGYTKSGLLKTVGHPTDKTTA